MIEYIKVLTLDLSNYFQICNTILFKLIFKKKNSFIYLIQSHTLKPLDWSIG